MSQADSENTTIATLPPAQARAIPNDPDVARALLTVGRHLERLESKMQVAWSTPGDSPTFRKALEQWVQEMIDALDLMSADPDIEDDNPGEENGDVEPSLGSTQMMNQQRWSEGHSGTEWDADREKDDADNEPSLGSIASSETRSQERWADGGSDDREDDNDSGIGDEGGLQEQMGSEPSLGSFDNMMDQTKSWRTHDGPTAAWACTDGEFGGGLSIAELDARRAEYREKHPYAYRGVGGVFIPPCAGK